MEELKIPESWTFENADVARHFDMHVREQLPWYDNLTTLVAVLAKHYLPEKAVAYDIGASTGNLGAALADIIKERRVDWIGIDSAEAMKACYRAPGRLEIADALDYPFKPFDLAVCFLSMMFMPADRRRQWLFKLLSTVKIGGAIIVVDRQQPAGGCLSTAMARMVWKLKTDAGAGADAILRKEMSLCGIQRPLPRDFFNGMDATEFFRFGDFAGWIIERREVAAGGSSEDKAQD